MSRDEIYAMLYIGAAYFGFMVFIICAVIAGQAERICDAIKGQGGQDENS